MRNRARAVLDGGSTEFLPDSLKEKRLSNPQPVNNGLKLNSSGRFILSAPPPSDPPPSPRAPEDSPPLLEALVERDEEKRVLFGEVVVTNDDLENERPYQRAKSRHRLEALQRRGGTRGEGTLSRPPMDLPPDLPGTIPEGDETPKMVRRDRSLTVCSDRTSKISREIISSERVYNSNLELVLKYITQLRTVLSEPEIKKLFSNIESIKMTSDILLERLSNFDNDLIELGNAFNELVPLLKLYTQYVNDFGVISAYCVDLRNHTDIGRFLRHLDEVFRQEYHHLLGLEDILIMPVQRVPRYVLLLSDLLLSLKNDPTQSAYIPVRSALDSIQTVAKALNEKKSHRDNLEEMYRITNSIDIKFSLLDPSRKFLMEGEFVQRWGETQGKELKFFLFNDIFVICSKLKNKLNVSTLSISKSSKFIDYWNINETLSITYDNKFVMMDYPDEGNYYILEVSDQKQAIELTQIIQQQILKNESQIEKLEGLGGEDDFFRPTAVEGYLKKLGDGIPIYRKRYFRLKGNTLFYYINATATKHSGYVDLLKMININMSNNGKETSLHLLHDTGRANTTLKICDESQTTEWLMAIKDIVPASGHVLMFLNID